MYPSSNIVRVSESISKMDTDDVKNTKFWSGIFQKKFGNLEENEKTKLELVMDE